MALSAVCAEPGGFAVDLSSVPGETVDLDTALAEPEGLCSLSKLATC